MFRLSEPSWAGAVIYIEPADQSAANRVIPQFREVTEREREREREREAEEVRERERERERLRR